MKPFATLGSEIGKVRARVRERTATLRAEAAGRAELLSPAALRARLSTEARDQREKLLARLGEQTLMLIAERKLVVPTVLREPVERLAALLGLRLPSDPPVVVPETKPKAAANAAEEGPAKKRRSKSRPKR